MKRFLPALLLTVVIVLAAPFVGLIRDHLFDRFQAAAVRNLTLALVALAGGVFLYAVVRIRRRRFWRYAGLALTARKLAATESTFALSTYVIAGPMLASALVLPGNYAPPDAAGWGLFVLAGLCSAGAWVGIVGGYRRAAPAVLAPFEYTALIGAAIAGYLIWNEVPDRYVVIGGAVIILSGLYVVYREIGGNALSTRYLRAFSAGATAAIARRLSRR